MVEMVYGKEKKNSKEMLREHSTKKKKKLQFSITTKVP